MNDQTILKHELLYVLVEQEEGIFESISVDSFRIEGKYLGSLDLAYGILNKASRAHTS